MDSIIKALRDHVDIIRKLETFAAIIEENIDYNGAPVDTQEIEVYTENIKHIDCDWRVKSYSEYIYGASIPFYGYLNCEDICKRIKESEYRSDIILGQLHATVNKPNNQR